jgi:inhibitor of KinA sporulation pathway (predicted exonuclease)
MMARQPIAPPPRLYVSLDLEFNQPSQRIIQIGATLGDIHTGARLGRFSVFVNPGEPLAPEIADLCGIAPGVLETAGDLSEAYGQLQHWLKPFKDERRLNPLTWGGGDSESLRQALGLEDERWLFGRRWVDVKTVYVAYQDTQGSQTTGGLATSMKRLGLHFDGRKHDAADDAWNTFRMYRRLLELMRSPAERDSN